MLLLFGMAVLVLHFNIKIAAIYDSHIKHRLPTLPVPTWDVFHSNFEPFLAKHHWCVDAVIATTFMIWLTIINWAAFDDTLINVIVFYSIRGICIATTTGYTSMRQHKGHHGGKKETGMNFAHTDLVISGHTGGAWIMALDIMQYGSGWKPVVSLMLAISSAFFNLANGDHYTSDVILGMLLPALIHSNVALHACFAWLK